jgi:hypothetical protein
MVSESFNVGACGVAEDGAGVVGVFRLDGVAQHKVRPMDIGTHEDIDALAFRMLERGSL